MPKPSASAKSSLAVNTLSCVGEPVIVTLPVGRSFGLVTSAVAADAVQTLAAQSLFDTEPEQLHTVLESLAEEDPA